MTITDLAWIAGFFEGEGSVGCYRRYERTNTGKTRSFSFNVCIAQKDRAILEWIKTFFGGTISYRVRTASFGLHIWRLDLRSSYAIRFLELVTPFLKTRRKIAQVKRAFARMKKWRKHEKKSLRRRAYEKEYA